ncbi:MAG: 3-phosphoshikimate 1-carboxyvinyltransferase [Zetaproteobacteria bacterium]|nr:MAG: 3-phosphoshikimate 1-carboxyvinyltransferase [Zetaproteobacteria bacterium]
MNVGGTLIAGPAEERLSGAIKVPGDKSISHRAVMLAALAEGETRIDGFLPGEDCLATAKMFADMGVAIDWLNEDKTSLKVCGNGLHGLKPPTGVLDAGNSGTCVRLMAGVLAGQPFEATLTGDASLRRRPMRRVVDPLRRMGAVVRGEDDGNLLPITIRGGRLRAIDFESPVASAQVKSCVLLAGLYADGRTTVREPRPTRDHTERMLPLFGQPVDRMDDGRIALTPRGRLLAPEGAVSIPADPSSAAFFAVAASIVPSSRIRLMGVGMNPRRDGWLRILRDMGGWIGVHAGSDVGGEPVADVEIAYQRLEGVEVNPADVPDAIDEFPILFVAASLANGAFVLRGAEELRVKESDRIATMAKGLSAMGVSIEEHPDGVVIQGGARLRGGVCVDAKGDHRIAMAMAVAAQMADAPIEIHNAAAIDTSFPGFVPLAQVCGMNVHWEGQA